MSPKSLVMKKIWLKLLDSILGLKFNCRRATFLIEKTPESTLSFKENIEMRLHLLNCPVCRRYKEQSQVIQTKLLSHFKSLSINFVPMKSSKKQELDRILQEAIQKKKST
jgi:hypothetical protein